MPSHSLKLLFLLPAFGVAPATAGHHVGALGSAADSPCPHERARLDALVVQHQAQLAPARPTRITLTGRVPNDSSQPGVAPGRFFTP
jgi:hypothetical protein